LERARLMKNLRTSKYKSIKYFVNQNKNTWEVVEFPTNDIVQVFKEKLDAELFSEQINKTKPFGDRPLPKFLKSYRLDIRE
jgi:hypothetical protein